MVMGFVDPIRLAVLLRPERRWREARLSEAEAGAEVGGEGVPDAFAELGADEAGGVGFEGEGDGLEVVQDAEGEGGHDVLVVDDCCDEAAGGAAEGGGDGGWGAVGVDVDGAVRGKGGGGWCGSTALVGECVGGGGWRAGCDEGGAGGEGEVGFGEEDGEEGCDSAAQGVAAHDEAVVGEFFECGADGGHYSAAAALQESSGGSVHAFVDLVGLPSPFEEVVIARHVGEDVFES